MSKSWQGLYKGSAAAGCCPRSGMPGGGSAGPGSAGLAQSVAPSAEPGPELRSPQEEQELPWGWKCFHGAGNASSGGPGIISMPG